MRISQERPNSFMEQKTATLIFGIAGRIGSGASFVTKALIEELKAFGYKTIEIKISKLFFEQDFCCDETIRSDACRLLRNILKTVDDDFSNKNQSSTQRIKKLQKKGNSLREKYGNNIIAALSIYFITENLHKNDVLENEGSRYAYVIDSLKHPDEVKLLRTVFREAFCMIGAVASDSVRKRRLQDQKHLTESEFEEISQLDAGKDNKNGQQTTKAILESDYFFENNYDTPEKINQECKRLLNLLFQSAIVTPRQDEYGMHLAFATADKSACLSRQVGAAIISENGNILATGHNDVPKFGGGLYSSESIRDNRCFVKSGMCHNDFEKQLIAEEIIERIKGKGEHYQDIKKLLETTRLNQLIEFSRAVHAEMDAIVTVARSGTSGIIGSTMYVTTYPCHNCAKHIIDAGIKRVVFLEPYEKSLALKLHSDAINNPLEESRDDRVSFNNYGGVSPKKYAELFSMHKDRKYKRNQENNKKGQLIRRSREKEKSDPLNAQESVTFKSRLQQFKKWFDQEFSE